MNQQQSNLIDRRTFLAMGLAAPIETLSARGRGNSPTLFPVSMDRCVVATEGRDIPFMARRLAHCYEAPKRLDESTELLCERASPIWHCEIVHGVSGHLMRDWWLLVSKSEDSQPHLAVIQPSSAVPENAGLLAARITFRLHVLQRRRVFQGDFNKHQIVRRVNQQILRAMDNMPS